MIKHLSHIIAISLIIGTLSTNAIPTNAITPPHQVIIPILETPNNNNGNYHRADVKKIIDNMVCATFITYTIGMSYRIYQERDKYEFESLESAQTIFQKLRIIDRNIRRFAWGPTMENPRYRKLENLLHEGSMPPRTPVKGIYGMLQNFFQTQNPDKPKDTESAA